MLIPDKDLIDICIVPEYHGKTYLDINNYAERLYLAINICRLRDVNRQKWYDEQQQKLTGKH